MSLLLLLAPALPVDPFENVYDPPRAEEVGTGAGQLRIFALGGGGIGKGLQLVGQGTLEWMPSAFIGVRASSRAHVFTQNGDPMLWALELGPSLHFLPYRRLDFSIAFAGGLGLVDLFEDKRTAMPLVSGALAFDLALSSYWVLHAEGVGQAGIADRNGSAKTYVVPSGLVGLGLVL